MSEHPQSRQTMQDRLRNLNRPAVADSVATPTPAQEAETAAPTPAQAPVQAAQPEPRKRGRPTATADEAQRIYEEFRWKPKEIEPGETWPEIQTNYESEVVPTRLRVNQTIRLDPHVNERLRSALAHLPPILGYAGVTDFTNAAFMREIERLEHLYNDGKPWPEVPGKKHR